MSHSHFHSLLILFLIFPFLTYAYTPLEVSKWTERTLRITLSVGYHADISQAVNVRKHFLPAAWRPMQAFFENHLHPIHDKKLVLNPAPVSPAVIISPKDCYGASCWRVHQSFFIPELHNRIDITAIVMTPDPAHKSALVIRSMDILISNY
ncbi:MULTISPECIES: hypothetical protein [unclassified Legionella]|uniref:hypothetical protein n=1 Tax=unclassified Legionella TaxID=2622702 RepID=UPI001054B199|nr:MULTISPECIES: hypothetical protein [unclassified Legionella]MDI9819080.1 hypothetical protein [Legionella sp. PL877]